MSTRKTILWKLGGVLALAALVSLSPAAADQVFVDDVIIQGSLCVGFDCVNGESFGFDTIRLKENNTRIRSVDTSVSASFPSRDWEITFNETSNGGRNKFSITDIDGGRIPFTIEAGAPSNSLYVEDGGRVGFGTATPVVDLHVVSGNTPTLRLEQDGSSGFGAQTWDLAGNEANLFIRDATNGSTLPFRIFPAGPSNAIAIEGSTGDVGMGTTSPAEALHVFSSSTGRTEVEIENTNATTQNVGLRMTNNLSEWILRNNNAGNLLLNGNANGIVTFMDTGGVTTNVAANFEGVVQSNGVALTSTRERKTGFEPVDAGDVLARLEALEITRWRFKDDPNGARHIGPVAEDFTALFELSGNGKRISVTDANGVALAAIKGLAERNRELESELAELKALVLEMAANR